MFRSVWYFIFIGFLLFGCIKNTSQTHVSPKETFYLSLSTPPTTLHPIRSVDAAASRVHGYVLESLAKRNVDTWGVEPSLAEKWTISADQKVYTFYLRKQAYFHNGQPITAHDVKFSFDAIMDVSYGGPHLMSLFENIEKVEVMDDHTIKFYTKGKRFQTFEKLAIGLAVIPKSVYENKKTGLNFKIVGSGPYVLREYVKNKRIVLEKNNNWWGNDLIKDKYNFKYIVYRIIQSTVDELLRMAQGQLDFLGLSPESYYKKTSAPPWGETVLKKKIKNSSAKGYSFIAWNLNNPILQDVKVRKALSHLLHRSLINEKFGNNANNLVAGPVYPQSEYADPHILPVKFSPKKAQNILQQAGWSDSDKNGILDKTIDGQQKELRFTILFPAKTFEKYLTIYQQDLKNNGIQVDLKFIEWVSFMKLIDERNFDGVMLAWISSALEWYPKQIWHSTSTSGSNFIDYSNPKVDELIDQSEFELNRKKRIQMLRKAYKLIAEDHPYSFLFSPRYHFYAHSKRMKIERDTHKYKIGIEFWKFDK